MNDFERQVREAMSAMVADAEPPPAVMEGVRRRHRRRNGRLAALGAVIIALVVAVAPVVNSLRAGGARPGHGHTSGRLLFPGGGRMLLEAYGELKWLYPDGKTVRIARGFHWAEVAAGRLVAVGKTGAYVMNLDGSRRHLVLRFRPGKRNGANAVGGLSPDGSRLAYYVGTDPVVTGDTLWVVNLATGRRVELGRVSSDMWRDNTTILATSVDGNTLLLINAQSGSRSVYLRPLSDPRLITAYQRAQPSAGRPAVMNAGGFSSSRSSAAFAVQLGAAGPYVGRRPAEAVLLGGSRVVTYAPATPQQFIFEWGPGGMFLIRTGAGDGPGTWKTYAGSIQSGHLAQAGPYGMDGATFNPAGDVIALQDDGVTTFLPTPRPACEATAECLHFQPKFLSIEGAILAWVP
jgi:hypothetical protein